MTTAVIETNVQQLSEHIQDWRASDVEVDQTQRIVRNIALTGLESTNGYRYTEQALREAISLYENKPVFLDHAANVSQPYDRSTRDLVGSIINARFQNGRIRSDIQTLDTEAGRTFIALATLFVRAVGMSHVVLAERSRDKSVVEKIHDVVSVDAVVFPATTSTFREQNRRHPSLALPGSYEAILRQIDETLNEHWRRFDVVPSADARRVGVFPGQILVEATSENAAETSHFAIDWMIEKDGVRLAENLTSVDAEMLADGSWRHQQEPGGSTTDDEAPVRERLSTLETRLSAVIAERDELSKQVAQFESGRRASGKQQEIDQLLEESDLPDYAVTNVFRKQLDCAPDRNTRVALITERQSILNQHVRQSPMSRERLDYNDSEFSDSVIVSRIKQHRRSILAGVG